MTDKELDQAWDYLGEACFWCDPIIKYRDLPANLKLRADSLHDTHSFMEMISSILTYEFDNYFDTSKTIDEIAKEIIATNHYANKSAEPIGWINAQKYAKDMLIDYIDNAQIIRNTHTDSDGLSYNSVKFKKRPASDVGREFLNECKKFNQQVKELSETPEYKDKEE